ncbi:MAG: hypothetical protein AB7T22_14285 [Calditrichaceae bacterium]
MNKYHLYLKNGATVFFIMLFLFSCSPNTLNDFFGIKMNAEDSNEFKIVSYTQSEGARYERSSNMNPKIYAYAEFDLQAVIIKVVNTDVYPLTYNYNYDQFIIYTVNDDKMNLIKGSREKYPSKNIIKPNEAAEFKLELPSDFWKTIGMRNPQSHNADYMEEFWKGENSLRNLKQDIKLIEVRLGDETVLILKPIPPHGEKI